MAEQSLAHLYATKSDKGHTHTGAEITSVVAESTHAISADSAANATNATNATNASNVPFSGITSKPTTLAGYGITDAAGKTHTHTKVQITDFSHTHAISDLSGVAAASHSHAGSDILTSVPLASKLSTARTINGVSFDGTANITVEPYIEQDTTTNAARYLTFVDSSTANYQRLNIDTVLTYNPSTNLLATSISGNATTAGGLAVNSTGLNNVANQIVRTNASGYVMCGYINSTASVTASAATHYWVQTGSDGYLRPKTLAAVKEELGIGAASASGRQLFTSSGTFVVPAGITGVYITMCGGGGGGAGGPGGYSSGACSGGGGGGASSGIIIKYLVTVTPGQSIAVTVGAGGSGGAGTASSGGVGGAGGQGGTSSFGAYISIPGGRGGAAATGSSAAGGTGSYFGCAGGGGGGLDEGGYPAAGYPGDGTFGGIGGTAGGSTYSGGGGGGAGLPFLLIGTSVGGNGGNGVYYTAAGNPGGAGTGYGAGGGGGSGARKGLLSGNGGNGAPGFVLVEW